MLPSFFLMSRSIHPRLPDDPPSPRPGLLRPRVDARPVRRQAPARGPLAKSLDLVARSDGHRDDVLGGLNERDIGRSGGHGGAEPLGGGAFLLRDGLLGFTM